MCIYIMIKIFVICNKSVEVERHDNLISQFKDGCFNVDSIEFFCNTWKTDIDDKHRYNKIFFENLKKGEISILINHIELLKKIKNEFKEGNFLIMESDAHTFGYLKFTNERLNEVCENSKDIKNWDIINIGGSCQQIFNEYNYPKTEPIKFKKYKYYNEDRLICIEGLIWNYNSICKFLDLFEIYINIRHFKISEPIDVIIDNLVKNKKLNIFWCNPALFKQGSGSIWNSYIRQ